MSNCTSCSKEILSNAKFCKFCGANQALKSQPDAETSVSKKIKYVQACKKCGNELIPNAKFCKHCGIKVISDAISKDSAYENINTAAINPPVSNNKIESVEISHKVHSPSINTKTVNNKKTGISGVQIYIGLATITIFAVFVFIAKSNDIALPAILTTPSSPVAAEPPAAELQAEVDTAQQAALKQAEYEIEQKKLAEEEAKRLEEAEKTTAIADAEEQKRLEHEEKLFLLEQQKEENAKRASELKKAREEFELAKLQAKSEGERLVAESASLSKEIKAILQATTPQPVQQPSATSIPATPPTAIQGNFKAKFKGFLGLKVATRYYATEEMKNRALQLWKDEGKILEPDGTITVLQQENKAEVLLNK
jgi:hypothetical protein